MYRFIGQSPEISCVSEYEGVSCRLLARHLVNFSQHSLIFRKLRNIGVKLMRRQVLQERGQHSGSVLSSIQKLINRTIKCDITTLSLSYEFDKKFIQSLVSRYLQGDIASRGIWFLCPCHANTFTTFNVLRSLGTESGREFLANLSKEMRVIQRA